MWAEHEWHPWASQCVQGRAHQDSDLHKEIWTAEGSWEWDRKWVCFACLTPSMCSITRVFHLSWGQLSSHSCSTWTESLHFSTSFSYSQKCRPISIPPLEGSPSNHPQLYHHYCSLRNHEHLQTCALTVCSPLFDMLTPDVSSPECLSDHVIALPKIFHFPHPVAVNMKPNSSLFH